MYVHLFLVERKVIYIGITKKSQYIYNPANTKALSQRCHNVERLVVSTLYQFVENKSFTNVS